MWKTNLMHVYSEIVSNMKKIYVHGSFRGSNFGDYLLFKLADYAVKNNNCTAVYDHISPEYQALNPVEEKSIL